MIQYNFSSNSFHQLNLRQIFRWIGKYWFQLVLCFFLVHFYRSVNIQVVVSPSTETGIVQQTAQFSVFPNAVSDSGEKQAVTKKTTTEKEESYPVNKNLKSSDFRNLSFILNPTFAKRKGVPPIIVAEKMQNCKAYVEQYANTAVAEMDKYGIPASITLAQGLLETDAGGSRLATESNNHFGIKCRSKCRGCTCRNYVDDDVYDMFRVFDSVWESYREHSKLLQISRYAKLKDLGTSDYKNWARGLKKAGYATDKNYHKKLIRIVEVLELHRFDK